MAAKKKRAKTIGKKKKKVATKKVVKAKPRAKAKTGRRSDTDTGTGTGTFTGRAGSGDGEEARSQFASMTQEVAEKALDRVEKLTSLLDVAKAMTAERDFNQLLALIMREARDCVEADRTSLFIIDREREELWSKIAQGLEIREIRVPLGKGIAGFVAESGETVNILDAYDDPRFDKSWDVKTGYRTRAVMCVPMINAEGAVVGVLQAINKRGDGAFDQEDQELMQALAAQAGAAVVNALLNDEIDRLFEGFVKASVYAIESRDPTTSGHSERVATLTLGIAEALPRTTQFRSLVFTAEELRELRYASLLHDFGKVGVREHVLVKANKLLPAELEIVRSRFHLARRTLECDCLREQVDHLKRAPHDHDHLTGMEAALAQKVQELDGLWKFVEVCNRPTLLPEGSFEQLHEVRKQGFIDPSGTHQSLLRDNEVEFLSVRKGSLTQAERLEIESHVVHTYRFLSAIPWTRDLRRIPAIAYAHHEKLDGLGYPRHLPAAEIPVQSRMMAIADIYDALTASDRPYKKAVPHEKALDILVDESRQGKLDASLLAVFIEGKVPEVTKVMPAAQLAGPPPDNQLRGAQ